MLTTAVYIGPLAFIYLVLAFRVIRHRYRLRLALGSGGDKAIERAIRVHANFAEYVPFALLAIAGAEAGGVAPLVIHGLGSALVLGRLSHAIGVSQDPEPLILRQIGMATTLTVIFLASLLATFYALPRVFGV